MPIGATTRATVKVNDVVGPDKNVSIKVEADAPIVAERPMYFNYGDSWTGGHDVVGAPPPRHLSTSPRATPGLASTSGSA